MFPTLDFTADTLHVQLIGSSVVALVLIVATRGRLGLRVEQPVPEPAAADPEDDQERRAVSSR